MQANAEQVHVNDFHVPAACARSVLLVVLPDCIYDQWLPTLMHEFAGATEDTSIAVACLPTHIRDPFPLLEPWLHGAHEVEIYSCLCHPDRAWMGELRRHDVKQPVRMKSYTRMCMVRDLGKAISRNTGGGNDTDETVNTQINANSSCCRAHGPEGALPERDEKDAKEVVFELSDSDDDSGLTVTTNPDTAMTSAFMTLSDTTSTADTISWHTAKGVITTSPFPLVLVSSDHDSTGMTITSGVATSVDTQTPVADAATQTDSLGSTLRAEQQKKEWAQFVSAHCYAYFPLF